MVVYLFQTDINNSLNLEIHCVDLEISWDDIAIHMWQAEL
jgi:hypothetical protein